jgi:hypothetical protein
VGYNGPWFDFNAAWKYQDLGVDLGSEWRQPSYDDSTWPSGAGLLGFPIAEPLPDGLLINTELFRIPPLQSVQPITYYFRRHFFFLPEAGMTITLSNLVDDGAVFHLNGLDIGRLGMPTGQVNDGTLATRSDDIVSAGHGYESVAIAPTSFVSGMNVLAVEVHQVGITSADAVFGSLLHVHLPSVPLPAQPDTSLHMRREGLEIVISWLVEGAELFASDTLDTFPADWMPVVTSGREHRVSIPASNRFYRLVW